MGCLIYINLNEFLIGVLTIVTDVSSVPDLTAGRRQLIFGHQMDLLGVAADVLFVVW